MLITDQMNGLTENQVLSNRKLHGSNAIEISERRVFWQVLADVMLEPMLILLIAACVVYFLVGKMQEGIIMLVSIIFVAGISVFQDFRSRNAVKALKKLSDSKATVIRGGIRIKIASEEIVVGDIVLLEEGDLVPADGWVRVANDFSLNESIITGESVAVGKLADGNSQVFKGTLVISGSAVIQISAAGMKTKFGQIGLSMQEIKVQKTPLQLQIKSFVTGMVWIGAIEFVVVVGINYYQTGNFVDSFLQGLTLAMSILPEEIPVAYSTFQALGAFRLLKHHIIVKQPQFVETLGSATVICADKTGTLTQNKMSVASLYVCADESVSDIDHPSANANPLIEYAMWSSEINPFDPMEQAIHHLYEKTSPTDKRLQYHQVHEYPIGGRPPMMTHIFKNEANDYIIAAKGAPEAFLQKNILSASERIKIEKAATDFAKQGFRVLGVGRAVWKGTSWPSSQEHFSFELLGLLAFQDPPKENIKKTIAAFNKAGISVKMITGDYEVTALAISEQINLDHHNAVITGKEALEWSDQMLDKKVKEVNVFARMFPEAKLKVIEALKRQGEVVAMTGDGVNDGPALKAAHIGIAMGTRGSEVAKSAASLILTDDDLSHMVEAVALGRKIYDNLKKAIRYIISIHIPIILIVLLPLLLGWKFPHIFSPVHVIFLELIMGPTCSIIYENEPIEVGTMLRMPRKASNTFLSLKQLWISIIQGLMITACCLSIGYYFMMKGTGDETIRSLVFITLLFSNVLLTLVNRSFVFSVFQTLKYRNNLVGIIISVTLVFIFMSMYVPFVRNLFELAQLSLDELALCMLFAIVGVCWMECWKFYIRRKVG